MKMKKTIIIINGKGGSGKDTFVNIISKYYKVQNVSSIDPIKNAASLLGWTGSKEDKDRKFLSDMKRLSVLYNDFPMRYISQCIGNFLVSENMFLFIHIREPEEISKLESKLSNFKDIDYFTLLIRRPITNDVTFGNSSDDLVDQYGYNYTYLNEIEGLSEMEFPVLSYFGDIILERINIYYPLQEQELTDTSDDTE